MTEQIDYSKVDWTGLKLPDGCNIEPHHHGPLIMIKLPRSVTGKPVAKRLSSEWQLFCARSVIPEVLELIELVDSYAKEWNASQNTKRTEVVRFEPRTIIVEKGTHEEFSVKSTISKATADAIFAGTVGCRFEIVINKIG